MENIKNILLDYHKKGYKDYVVVYNQEVIEEEKEDEVIKETNEYYNIYLGKDLDIKDNNVVGNGLAITYADNCIILHDEKDLQASISNITYSNINDNYINLISYDLSMLFATNCIAFVLVVLVIFNWLRSWFGRVA